MHPDGEDKAASADRRQFLRGAAGVGLATAGAAMQTACETTPAPFSSHREIRSGVMPVNGLSMYYEVHGEGPPLVLLHGAFMTIDSAFGKILPALGERQIIAVELQGHGRTADTDRPLRHEMLADDVAALLDALKVGRADVFGYSLGAIVALHLSAKRPDIVRKLVVASPVYNNAGYYPEVHAMIASLTPEMLASSPWAADYQRLAPKPANWASLVAKVQDLDRNTTAWTAPSIRAIGSPTLIIVGDADIVRPEHAVDLFRLRGGGRPGDISGLPNSRLLVIPATAHAAVMERVEFLVAAVPAFLDEPTLPGAQLAMDGQGEADIRAAIDRYAAAWRSGEFGAISACYHADFTLHYFGDNDLSGDHVGKPQALSALSRFSQRTRRRLLEIRSTMYGEHRGAILARESMQHGDQLVEMDRLLVYSVRDGLLHECWVFDQDQRLIDSIVGRTR